MSARSAIEVAFSAFAISFNAARVAGSILGLSSFPTALKEGAEERRLYHEHASTAPCAVCHSSPRNVKAFGAIL